MRSHTPWEDETVTVDRRSLLKHAAMLPVMTFADRSSSDGYNPRKQFSAFGYADHHPKPFGYAQRCGQH
jgi:hypothetical protein